MSLHRVIAALSRYASTGTYYHSSRTLFHVIDQDLCLTLTPEASFPYLNGADGFLYTITLSNPVIAHEDDIKAVGAELGLDGYVFEIADSRKAQKALAENFDVCVYTDLGPDNAYEHETVRVLRPKHATIARVQPVIVTSDGYSL